MTMRPRSKVVAALSPARMRPYLDRCNGNEKAALALYAWHSELTAAVQTVLGNTEVILRNAMDEQLQKWNAQQAHQSETTSWLLAKPAFPLRGLVAGKRLDALRRARNQAKARPSTHRRYGVPVNHDDVLAQLMFGVWKDLLPNHHPAANPDSLENRNRMFLWTEALQAAFPRVADPDGSITYRRVTFLHQLRNRVSHMEPLLDINVKLQTQTAFDLVASIDGDVVQWLTGRSKVSQILNNRPR